tara:strand:- start:1931 stop:3061 length:1131 start_codon:yes stop_codon:yes gene_type:complete
MRILTVFGTRPEAIKMAPLVLALNDHSEIEHRLCVTGQHREMLDQVLDLFNISPDYDLSVMKPGQTLSQLTSRIITSLDAIILDFKPEIILVHGDTSSTFCSSLCGYYHQIDIGHVEAGLRTGDIYSPWPEEGNRKLVGSIAKYHFAPTIDAKKNLLSENISESNIFVTGNTVIDALYLTLNMIQSDKKISEQFSDAFPNIRMNEKIVLITGHRRENFGEGFENICHAIKALSIRNPEVDFVYPVHLNPKVRKPVGEMLSNQENIHLIEPLGYVEFVYLMSKSYIILTDSGGIQEEAPSLGKPVLVMRDTTERPEAVEAGTVKLVGTSQEHIIQSVDILLNDAKQYDTMSKAHNPYGDGEATHRIISVLTGGKINE